MIMNALQIRNHKIGDRVVLNAGEQAERKDELRLLRIAGSFILHKLTMATENAYSKQNSLVNNK